MSMLLGATPNWTLTDKARTIIGKDFAAFDSIDDVVAASLEGGVDDLVNQAVATAVPAAVDDVLTDGVDALVADAVSGLTLTVDGFGVAGDGVTDDTAALQAAIDTAVSQGRTLFIKAGRYLTTGTLHANGTDVKIQGEPGTEIFASGNHTALNITQTHKYDQCIVTDLVFLTDREETATGLYYENLDVQTGEMTIRVFQRLIFMSHTLYDNEEMDRLGHRAAIHLYNADRARVIDCQVRGPRAINMPFEEFGWPNDTFGILIENSTMVKVARCHFTGTAFGARVQGQSESVEFVSCAMVRNRVSVQFRTLNPGNHTDNPPGDNPANGHYVLECHIAATQTGIDMNAGGVVQTCGHIIRGNFILRRMEAVNQGRLGGYRSVVIGNAMDTHIDQNLFYRTDRGGTELDDIGVDLRPDANRILVTGNRFTGTGTAVRNAGTGNVIANNHVTEPGHINNRPELTGPAIIDTGTGTIIGENFGDSRVRTSQRVTHVGQRHDWTLGGDANPTFSIAPGRLGFFRNTPTTQPTVPAGATAQDVVDALVALGLVSQSS